VPGNLARSESASGTWRRGIRRLTALAGWERGQVGDIRHTGSLRQVRALRLLLLRGGLHRVPGLREREHVVV